MSVAKVIMKAWGLVSVGAVGCDYTGETTTLPMTQGGDIALDSQGNVYFTDRERDQVYMCPEQFRKWSDCKTLDMYFNHPDGIAVDDSGAVPVVYVSEGIIFTTEPKVNRCPWHIGQSEEWFNCSDFGGSNHASWTIPHGLAVDSKGNVFITYHLDEYHHGVWKCSPSAACALIGDTDLWLHYPPERVAVDSIGNVYVSGYYEPDLPDEHKNASYVKQCSTWTGTCADFGGDWPKSGDGYGIAVGSDDDVYIIDSGTNALLRCYPDNTCEKIDGGVFQGARSMAMDDRISSFPYNVLYVMDDDGLHRFCLSQSVNDIQV